MLILQCLCSVHINAEEQSQISFLGRGKWLQLQSRTLPNHQGQCWAPFLHMQTFQPGSEKLVTVCNMGMEFICGGAIMILVRVLSARGQVLSGVHSS